MSLIADDIAAWIAQIVEEGGGEWQFNKTYDIVEVKRLDELVMIKLLNRQQFLVQVMQLAPEREVTS